MELGRPEEQIWAVGKGALIAALVSAVSAVVGAGVIFWLVSGTGLEVPYFAWLSLVLIGIALTALCTFLSRLIANAHLGPSDLSIGTAAAIDTIGLGLGVLAPLTVQIFAVLYRADPSDLLDSALGNVLLIHLSDRAPFWYLVALVSTGVLALVCSLSVTGAAVSAASHEQLRTATRGATGLSVLLLAINTMLLQPWLPQRDGPMPNEASQSLAASLLPLLAVVLIAGGLLFITRGFMRAAAEAVVAASRASKSALLISLVALGGFALAVAGFAITLWIASLAISGLAIGGATVLGAARLVAGSLDDILTVFATVCALLFVVWLCLSALGPTLRWIGSALPKNVVARIAILLLAIGFVVGVNAALRPGATSNRGEIDAGSDLEGEQSDGRGGHHGSAAFARATVTCGTTSPEWMLADDRRLDFPIELCSVGGVEDSRAVIVVGSASAAGPDGSEEQRALERGWRLASRVPYAPGRRIYVLNLGEVDAASVRSVPIIAPYSFSAEASHTELVEAFRTHLSSERLPAHSICSLYLYDDSALPPTTSSSEPNFQC